MKSSCRRIQTVLLVCLLLSTAAQANSSWRWLSESRPYDILPIVALLTILIEYSAIRQILPTQRTGKIVLIVTLANLLSFAAPYILAAFGPIYTLAQALEHTPMYTVGTVYLVMTLAVEIPTCIGLLGRDCSDKKPLVLTLASSNILTTLLTAVAERLLCRGTW